MDPRIIPAKVEHLAAMAGQILEADRRELEDCYGVSAYYVLGQSFAASRASWAAVVDGEVIAMFGVVPREEPGTGRPWMIGTKHLTKHRYTFGKGCGDVIEAMLDTFPRLENIVDRRNRTAIAWLKWLGFELGETVITGEKALPYITFRMERKCNI